MKSKLNFIHICDYASTSEGGKLNILGIFENIFANNIPTTHPQLYVVTNTTIIEAGNYKQIIKIIREKDGVEILKPLELNISTPSEKSSTGMKVGFIGQFNNIKLDEFGGYLVQVFIDAEKIGEQKIVLTKPSDTHQ